MTKLAKALLVEPSMRTIYRFFARAVSRRMTAVITMTFWLCACICVTVAAAGAPGTRYGHKVCYDPVADEMYLFGGVSSGICRSDVWGLRLDEPNPIRWERVLPPDSVPHGVSLHSLIHDPIANRLIEFGGSDGTHFYNDLWCLDLASQRVWTEMHPTGTPPTPRYGHTAVYDPTRRRMIVFGGYGPGGHKNDTWELDLSADSLLWRELHPQGVLPAARHVHTAIFDALRDRMIVFGGGAGATQLMDVWALGFQPLAWTALVGPGPNTPTGTQENVAVYDPDDDRMIVFGGKNGPFGALTNGTWELTLGESPSWTNLSPSGTPPCPRRWHDGIWEQDGQRLLIYGGHDGGAGLDDTWELRNNAWQRLLPVPTGIGEGPPSSGLCQSLESKPNPFGGITELRFEIRDPSEVELTIYDVTGRHVRDILRGPLGPGEHVFAWDGRDQMGNPVSAGVFFCDLKVGGAAHSTVKVILIK